MKEYVFLKELALHGRVSGPADKYYDAPWGPTHLTTTDTKKKFEEQLQQRGRIIMFDEYKHLTYQQKGVIGFSSVFSFYTLNDMLIANQCRAVPGTSSHVVHILYKDANKNFVKRLSEEIKSLDFLFYEFWEESSSRKGPLVSDVKTDLKRLEYLIGVLDA